MKKPLHSIIGIYQNLARMSLFYYSDPIYIETMRVCVKTGHTFPFSGVVDLSGKRVGINRGWSYGEVFDSVHLVFAKRAELSIVLDRFNLGLTKMKENGSYSRIISEFIHGVKAD
jgi:ABC-type amino acid transport substrate-binding protein